MRKFSPVFMVILIVLIVGCAVKPVLKPVDIFQIDIGKDGKMYFELTDSHAPVVTSNRSNLPGIHHDVDELNYLPLPLVPYIKKNIIENLQKSPGLELLESVEGSDYVIHFNLQHIDVYRETSGGAAAAGILVGGLLGAAMMEEACWAEIRGMVTVTDAQFGEQLCSFAVDVKETASFRMNDVKKGYTDATQQALMSTVKQIVSGLTNC